MERDWKKGNLQVDKHKMFNFVTSMPRWRSLEALLQLSGLDWYQPLNLHGIIVAIVSASKKLLFQRASVDLVTSKLRAQESARVYISGDKCVAHIMQIQFFQDSSVNNFACNRGQRCWSVSCNRRLSLTLQLHFCVTFLHATLMRSSRILRQLLCKQKKRNNRRYKFDDEFWKSSSACCRKFGNHIRLIYRDPWNRWQFFTPTYQFGKWRVN